MFITDLLLESTTAPRHASFCFGRMNPPTIGHEQLIKSVGREAQGGDYFIFVSQTQDSKKNPLSYQQKIHFLRALYPGMASHFVYEPGLKTIMQVAEWLYNKGYTDVTFVAGSDRLPEFEKLLNAYNGVEGKGAYYKFNSINYASSGERDPDSEGVSGISASMAREAAVTGDFETFSKAVDAGELTQAMYDAVRAGMGVQDSGVSEGRRALPPGWKSKGWNPNIPSNKKPKEEPVKEDEFYPTKDDGGRNAKMSHQWTERELNYLQMRLVDVNAVPEDYYIAGLEYVPESNRYSAILKPYEKGTKPRYVEVSFDVDTGGGGPYPVDIEQEKAYGRSIFKGGFNEYEEFQPGESVTEGWKGALAGAALVGGIGAAMVTGNPLTIDGVTYEANWSGPDSPDEMQTSRIITKNGKKYQVWKGVGAKPRNRAWFYKEIKPQQQDSATNPGFNKEKWKKPAELEPTDLWVNEDIENGKMTALLGSVTEFLKKDPSLAGQFVAKDIGMRVWTRGDGTRHRDPARLVFDTNEQRDHAFNLLKQSLKGTRETTVTGEFGSSPAQEALVWKSKVFHKYGDFTIALGTASRITNKNSVWRENPTNESVNRSLASTKKSIQEEIAKLSAYVANKNNGGGAGILEAINSLKNKLASLNEMFGPMGGDQRNMRGSRPAYEPEPSFTGSVTVSYPNFKNYDVATKYKVKVSDNGESNKNLTITGDKKNIKRFLVASGWNSGDLRNWYPELHEDGESWAVEINGQVSSCNDKDHAMNKARSALSYKKADVVYILHNGTPVFSWKLGEKMQALGEESDTTASLKKDISDIANKIGSTLEKLNVQRAIRDKHLANQKQEPKTVKECSGYIPKNAKEAKDPRWSNALSVDVNTTTPDKNLKAFGLK